MKTPIVRGGGAIPMQEAHQREERIHRRIGHVVALAPLADASLAPGASW